MRSHIEHLSSEDMVWENPAPGVYMKMLNHNEADGCRTGLFRFVPDEGAKPPNVCHYHSVFEEIFILDGKMSFDSETWLGRHAYVFHPPYLVHGFNSSIPIATTFIARAPAELDFNFPELPQDKPPHDKQPFYVRGAAKERGLVYMQPTPEARWSPIMGPSDKELGRQCELSRNNETGEGSCLIRYRAGLELPANDAVYETFDEGFIIEGRVEAKDGTVWGVGDYWHRHPGTAIPSLSITSPTLLFSSTGPKPS